jgi:hypothetical protein
MIVDKTMADQAVKVVPIAVGSDWKKDFAGLDKNPERLASGATRYAQYKQEENGNSRYKYNTYIRYITAFRGYLYISEWVFIYKTSIKYSKL